MGDIEFLLDMCEGDCNRFLVGLRNGKMVEFDGCWSTLEEVGRARFLREQLRDSQLDWCAIHIAPVKSIEYEVNQEAIRCLNSLRTQNND